MSNDFFSKLILGVLGVQVLEAGERRHQEHKQAREQKWRDTINWQDATRRKDPLHKEDGSKKW